MINPFFYSGVPIKNIHDYLWFKITDFKSYPVHFDELRKFIKFYMYEVYL